ncbi:MAG: hypothetical protein Q8J88_10345 [Bacteroidales bacterium]|nr:hypothetical protein [Bacteroidales bacterium]
MTELNITPLNKRPVLLTTLCILSFIGSGMASLSNIFIYFNHDVLLRTIEEGILSDMGFDLSIMLKVEPAYFLISGLLNIISFTGVRHMWRLRRAGFHLYAISQLLMLIVSTLYIYKPSGVFPMFDLLLASTFILLYLRFRDDMK